MANLACTATRPSRDIATVQGRFRLGHYAEVLGDWRCDLALGDPPFSKRTHDAQAALGGLRAELPYKFWTATDVYECAEWLHALTSGWIVQCTDHTLFPAWEKVLTALGRYVFAPVPLVIPGMTCRMQGDGPSSWTSWLVIARPRTQRFANWGTRRGAYIRQKGDSRSSRHGGKPIGCMREIVRDYSMPGEIVLDTTAGHGTTLIAAELEGRVGVGAEIDYKVWKTGREAIAKHLADPILKQRSGKPLKRRKNRPYDHLIPPK